MEREHCPNFKSGLTDDTALFKFGGKFMLAGISSTYELPETVMWIPNLHYVDLHGDAKYPT